MDLRLCNWRVLHIHSAPVVLIMKTPSGKWKINYIPANRFLSSVLFAPKIQNVVKLWCLVRPLIKYPVDIYVGAA